MQQTGVDRLFEWGSSAAIGWQDSKGWGGGTGEGWRQQVTGQENYGLPSNVMALITSSCG